MHPSGWLKGKRLLLTRSVDKYRASRELKCSDAADTAQTDITPNNDLIAQS